MKFRLKSVLPCVILSEAKDLLAITGASHPLSQLR